MNVNITFSCETAPIAKAIEWKEKVWVEFSGIEDDDFGQKFAIFVPKHFESRLRRAAEAWNREISRPLTETISLELLEKQNV